MKTNRLSRNEAVKQSIKIWTEMLSTPVDKPEWVFDEYKMGCPLCQFVYNETGYNTEGPGCDTHCPYALRFGYRCTNARSPFTKWDIAIKRSECLKYVKSFLAQLKKIPLDPEPMFNEYAVAIGDEIVPLKNLVKELADSTALIADQLPPVEARLLFHEIADEMRARGSEYMIIRVMKPKKDKK